MTDQVIRGELRDQRFPGDSRGVIFDRARLSNVDLSGLRFTGFLAYGSLAPAGPPARRPAGQGLAGHLLGVRGEVVDQNAHGRSPYGPPLTAGGGLVC
ncbi:hypothetical protein [Nonomuraea sp. NPDC003214]